MTCRSRQTSKIFRRFARNLLQAVAFCGLLGAVCSAPNAGLAQNLNFSFPDVPVLTIEPDRLYSDTLFGQRVSKEIEDQGRKLSGENRRIENDLADEEEALTKQRESLSAEEFRDLADAFDQKVTKVRISQDEKARILAQTSDQAQRNFIAFIAPVLKQMMSDKGASVILDRRAVFASADSSDVTQEAIERINEALGDGEGLDALLQQSDEANTTASEAPAVTDQ